MTTIESKLIEFARWVIAEHRENLGDIGGDEIQEKLEQLGLLVSVHVTEPCGEGCRCGEYDDFPFDCLRLVEEVNK